MFEFAKNKRIVIFAVVIVIFLISIFLYMKYKSYPEILKVGKNDLVATKIRKTLQCNMIETVMAPLGNLDNAIEPLFIDLTGKPVPSNSGINGIDGSSKSLHIQNIGTEDFNIIGVTLYFTPKVGAATKITQHSGSDTTTAMKYDGSKLVLTKNMWVRFTTLDNFILNRIVILCNNVVAGTLVVYIKNTVPEMRGIKLRNKTNEVIIVDLYKQ